MSGSFRPPRSPNIIWPSSRIIHYGRQWPEMLTRPKSSNIHTYILTYSVMQYRTKGVECLCVESSRFMTMPGNTQPTKLKISSYNLVGNNSATHPTVLTWHQAIFTCFLICRNALAENISTTMMMWNKMCKFGFHHRRHHSLTKAYKNWFPVMTSASITAETK